MDDPRCHLFLGENTEAQFRVLATLRGRLKVRKELAQGPGQSEVENASVRVGHFDRQGGDKQGAQL